ncbi:MAG TPA: head-tail connector protein [Rhizomicrobium sp.]|jgi:uncharacterized phiE125 gp8 family phage protein|nr:head-tail connector protein [Rhizomicrobium sp.]
MPLTLITPPAIELVTLTQAKAHLKVDTADDDTLISALIAAARARAEWHTGRALMTQSWILWLDAWPCDGIVAVPLPPLQAVTALTVYAPDDTPHVLDPGCYLVDTASSRVALNANVSPPTNLRRVNAVAVAFTSGYGSLAAAVPSPLAEAILALVAFLYENRGEAPAELPRDCLALLAPYRMLKL